MLGSVAFMANGVGCGAYTIEFPSSKTDQRGPSERRTLQCPCRGCHARELVSVVESRALRLTKHTWMKQKICPASLMRFPLAMDAEKRGCDGVDNFCLLHTTMHDG